ncbi:MAG: hypothetical protein K0S32_1517 [Bacteroidetes bacterium]|jgi:hypothetical protein|nr:hypothetical protein [Bacteroidota bacterium]
MKQLILYFLFVNGFVFGQIYNYDPVRHTNFETNPSILASSLYHITANITHHGNEFSPKKLFSTSARISMYNVNYFSGVGAVAGYTNINDSANYSYAGAGIAYRTILFGKVYTRVGVLCKLLSVKSAAGNFDNYSFSSAGENRIRRYNGSNVNVSFSFSSPADKYYVSGGILNYNLPGSVQTFRNFFPEYYVLSAGDLGKILQWRRWDINYTALAKKYSGKQISAVNHFATFNYMAVYLSRVTGIKLGARLGWTDSSYVVVSPMIQWNHSDYKKKRYRYVPQNRNMLFIQFMVDMGYDPVTIKPKFKPTPQFNLTYLL